MDNVTIAISTRNRVESLLHTIGSLARCEVPLDVRVTLVVVDNGSTDRTWSVLQSTKLENVKFQYLGQPLPGQGRSLQLAVSAFPADIYLFTDDDVRVPVSWIGDMTRPILCGEADAVQGLVEIAPQLHRPWLTPLMRMALAEVRDDGSGVPRSLVGANMAIRASCFSSVGGFQSHPALASAVLGEDTFLGLRLIEAGARLSFCGGPAAEHHFDESRLREEHLLGWMDRHGRAQAVLNRLRRRRAPFAPRSRLMLARVGLLFAPLWATGNMPSEQTLRWTALRSYLRHWLADRGAT